MIDLDKLIAELEVATEGNRELDEDIALAIGVWRAWLSKHRRWNFVGPEDRRFSWPESIPKYSSDTGEKIEIPDEPYHGWCWEADLPDYTKSVDAILTLVPPHLCWRYDSALGWAELFDISKTPVFVAGSGDDPSLSSRPPALALSIAIARAKRAEEKKA